MYSNCRTIFPQISNGSHHRGKAFYLRTLSVGGGDPPPPPSPWLYGHQRCTFFSPSYTPGNAYREVYTMAFSSISHQDLKYAWYLGTKSQKSSILFKHCIVHMFSQYPNLCIFSLWGLSFLPKKAYCNKQLFPHHLCLYSPLFCFWSLPNWQHTNYTNIPLCHPHFMSVVSTLFTRVDHSNWNLQNKI